MQQVTQNKQDQARAQQRDAQLVDAAAAFGRGGCCGSLELGTASSSNVSGGTRVAVREVSRAKSEISVVVDSLDVNGVHGSTAVASGSGSSPSHNLGFTAVNGQTISGLDFIDFGPANGCCDEGVDNVDAFVENENLGLQKEQPSQGCCGGNDTRLSQPSSISIKDDLKNKQNIDDQSQTRENDGGSWSERNEIGHQTILPPLQTTSSVEGK
ncbi:MAG: hypothetical protein RIR46_703 [Actinomycetota bacterium]